MPFRMEIRFSGRFRKDSHTPVAASARFHRPALLQEAA